MLIINVNHLDIWDKSFMVERKPDFTGLDPVALRRTRRTAPEVSVLPTVGRRARNPDIFWRALLSGISLSSQDIFILIFKKCLKFL